MQKEWWGLTPKMRLVICDADNFCMDNYHESPAWTSFIRTEQEQLALFNAGLTSEKIDEHMLGRGADKRIFGDDRDLKLIEYINGKYPYDPNRPGMVTVSFHQGTAKHLHFKTLI